MAGLIEKDIRLILTRKSNILIFILIGGLVTFQTEGIIGENYLTLLGALLALSTLSYDDADNSMTFLMTLPCTRKSYVVEKYLFIYGLSLLFGVIGSAIYIISLYSNGGTLSAELLEEMIVSVVPVFLLMGALLIPIQLKYGAERSRIAMFVLFGVFFSIIYLLGDRTTIIMGETMQKLSSLSQAAVLAVTCIILVAVVLISFTVSVHIMKKKEL